MTRLTCFVLATHYMAGQQLIRGLVRPPIHILAVEDDWIDAEALQRHVQSRPARYTLTVMPTPRQALDYLQTQALHSPIRLPHLILLDLNLPGMDGLTLLRSLRQDPKLRRTIVFILTTSALLDDLDAAYQIGISGYVLKQNVTAFCRWLDEYCTLVEFPPMAASALLPV